MTNELTPDRIMQTGLGFWASKTLLSAVELGVFTGLARGGKDCATLIRDHELHPRAARDFFDALVALGFLLRENGVYTNMSSTGVIKAPTGVFSASTVPERERARTAQRSISAGTQSLEEPAESTDHGSASRSSP